MDKNLKNSLAAVASFYDQRHVGHVGPLGFRRSTDLTTLLACLDRLLDEKIIIPGESMFLDMGCADGRVNVFLSYLVKFSVGIELDEWTLDEYAPLRDELEKTIKYEGLLQPPDNTFLFHGDSTDSDLHGKIRMGTGLGFEDFDIFYTYLIMYEEFAELIVEKAKTGAIFMVYGLNRIMPGFRGLNLLGRLSPLEGALALYRKE